MKGPRRKPTDEQIARFEELLEGLINEEYSMPEIIEELQPWGFLQFVEWQFLDLVSEMDALGAFEGVEGRRRKSRIEYGLRMWTEGSFAIIGQWMQMLALSQPIPRRGGE